MAQYTYEFQSTLFNNASDLADAIAEEWVTAGGANDEEEVARAFAECTDEELADEVISGWGLNQLIEYGYDAEGDPVERTWLETRGLDRDDIVAAFEYIRV